MFAFLQTSKYQNMFIVDPSMKDKNFAKNMTSKSTHDSQLTLSWLFIKYRGFMRWEIWLPVRDQIMNHLALNLQNWSESRVVYFEF